MTTSSLLQQRFRGYYPVVLDVETAGFNAQTDALLEIAIALPDMRDDGLLSVDELEHYHIKPFEGANLEPDALAFTGIDPYCALRGAIDEAEALKKLFRSIRKKQKQYHCQRSVIVAHNAAFDVAFVNAAIARNNIKRSPFHPFVSFDTTSMAALTLGQTVLAKACQAAGIDFDNKQAHSALYDTRKTAELFCFMVNRWKALGGWPLPQETATTSD